MLHLSLSTAASALLPIPMALEVGRGITLTGITGYAVCVAPSWHLRWRSFGASVMIGAIVWGLSELRANVMGRRERG